MLLYLSRIVFTLTICCYSEISGQRSFPTDFLFGAATSAYQIEGAWNESGKGVNIWDQFSHEHPEKIVNGATGDISCDSYHLYRKDIVALRELGANTYRFSLSWSRLLPYGYINVTSQSGIDYYNNLIDELIESGIQPMVTLYHWDTPETLQRIGGFTSESLVDLFVDFAEFAFRMFGDRVKYWLTFNEINIICSIGYATGNFAPGIDLPGKAEYLCAHYMILAHAKTYRMYHKNFGSTQNGQIGIAHQVMGYYPLSNSKKHVKAANMAQEFTTGWILNPILSKSGDYPQSLKDLVRKRSLAEHYPRSRLPEFTPEEIALVKGTADFLGVNHYVTLIFTQEEITDKNLVTPYKARYLFPGDVIMNTYQLNEWPIGDIRLSAIVPEGFRGVLKYIKKNYGNPPIIITENGFPYSFNSTGLNDHLRVDYIKKYLSSLLNSINDDNVDVRGYMHWSLLDNFEWTSGYSVMYGLYAVNFTSPTKERIGRLSSRVYRNIIRTKQIDFNYLPIVFNDATVI